MKAIASRLFCTLCIVATICCVAACSFFDKNSSDKALKNLTELADGLNSKCPTTQSNGTTLVSVSCVDNQLVYICKVPNSSLYRINAEDASGQILSSVSDKLKAQLIKANCSIVYKYTTDHDSVVVVIDPATIQEAYSKSGAAK